MLAATAKIAKLEKELAELRTRIAPTLPTVAAAATGKLVDKRKQSRAGLAKL
jgi:hypothetical protein